MIVRRALVTLGLSIACSMGCFMPAQAAVSCIFSASGVSFGNYDVLNPSPVLSNGTITFSCSSIPAGGVNVTIALDRGLHSAVFPNRNLAKGAVLLGYNLYQDAALTVIWGNGNNGTSKYGPISVTNTNPVTLTMYGRIPANQDVTAGSYSDTITATMTF